MSGTICRFAWSQDGPHAIPGLAVMGAQAQDSTFKFFSQQHVHVRHLEQVILKIPW